MPSIAFSHAVKLGRFYRLLLTATLFAYGCGHDVDPPRSFTSPDGALVADSYVLGGGGAAGWVAERVRLRRSNESFRDDDRYVLELISGRIVEVRWLNKDVLR